MPPLSSDIPTWASYTVTGGLGAVAAWVSLRLNGALVWRQNAEGYRAELERQEADHKREVADLNARITLLSARIESQEEVIRDLKHRTDVAPLYELLRAVHSAVVHPAVADS